MTDTAANVEPAAAKAVQQVAAQNGAGEAEGAAGPQSEKAKAKAEAKAKAKAEKEAKKAANVCSAPRVDSSLHCCGLLADSSSCCRLHSEDRNRRYQQKLILMTP